MMQASAEKLEQTGSAEKKRVASVPESSWQVHRSRLCQKKKEQSRQSRVSDHEGERAKVGENRTFAEQREITARAWREKDGLHTVGRQIPRRKKRASKNSFCRRSRSKHERVSKCKITPGPSAESWFHS